jgi:hypothetical protein
MWWRKNEQCGVMAARKWLKHNGNIISSKNQQRDGVGGVAYRRCRKMAKKTAAAA